MTEAEYQFKLATFAEFKALGPEVWRNWDFVKDHVFLGMQRPPRSKDVLACVLTYNKNPRITYPQRARGRSIYQRAERYELLLNPKLMDATDDNRRKILLHELVHLGYHGHGPEFRAVCKEVGGVVSGGAVDDPGFHMEKKVGARFKRMKTFDTEEEAQAWYRSPVETAKREMERAVIENELLKQGLSPFSAKKEAHARVRWRIVFG